MKDKSERLFRQYIAEERINFLSSKYVDLPNPSKEQLELDKIEGAVEFEGKIKHLHRMVYTKLESLKYSLPRAKKKPVSEAISLVKDLVVKFYSLHCTTNLTKSYLELEDHARKMASILTYHGYQYKDIDQYDEGAIDLAIKEVKKRDKKTLFNINISYQLFETEKNRKPSSLEELRKYMIE